MKKNEDMVKYTSDGLTPLGKQKAAEDGSFIDGPVNHGKLRDISNSDFVVMTDKGPDGKPPAFAQDDFDPDEFRENIPTIFEPDLRDKQGELSDAYTVNNHQLTKTDYGTKYDSIIVVPFHQTDKIYSKLQQLTTNPIEITASLGNIGMKGGEPTKNYTALKTGAERAFKSGDWSVFINYWARETNRKTKFLKSQGQYDTAYFMDNGSKVKLRDKSTVLNSNSSTNINNPNFDPEALKAAGNGDIKKGQLNLLNQEQRDKADELANPFIKNLDKWKDALQNVYNQGKSANFKDDPDFKNAVMANMKNLALNFWKSLAPIPGQLTGKAHTIQGHRAAQNWVEILNSPKGNDPAMLLKACDKALEMIESKGKADIAANKRQNTKDFFTQIEDLKKESNDETDPKQKKIYDLFFNETFPAWQRNNVTISSTGKQSVRSGTPTIEIVKDENGYNVPVITINGKRTVKARGKSKDNTDLGAIVHADELERRAAKRAKNTYAAVDQANLIQDIKMAGEPVDSGDYSTMYGSKGSYGYEPGKDFNDKERTSPKPQSTDPTDPKEKARQGYQHRKNVKQDQNEGKKQAGMTDEEREAKSEKRASDAALLQDPSKQNKFKVKRTVPAKGKGKTVVVKKLAGDDEDENKD